MKKIYFLLIAAMAGGATSGTIVNVVTITSADFSGDDYTNGLFATVTNYDVFSNDGSGTLLKINDGS